MLVKRQFLFPELVLSRYVPKYKSICLVDDERRAGTLDR